MILGLLTVLFCGSITIGLSYLKPDKWLDGCLDIIIAIKAIKESFLKSIIEIRKLRATAFKKECEVCEPFCHDCDQPRSTYSMAPHSTYTTVATTPVQIFGTDLTGTIVTENLTVDWGTAAWQPVIATGNYFANNIITTAS